MNNFPYLERCHDDWIDVLNQALSTMDKSYLHELTLKDDWLPGINAFLAAFSLPLKQTNYILLGESPYPRAQSANGFAFWDNAVTTLWSDKGLSKAVNRATSLRNWIKMMLVARGDLRKGHTAPEDIILINKDYLAQTATQLFTNMLDQGILLLNATLVYRPGEVPYHARHWRPFMHSLLQQLVIKKPSIELILFGKIAEMIPPSTLKIGLIAEHPYNISFISNQSVIDFFKPLDLLHYEHKPNHH